MSAPPVIPHYIDGKEITPDKGRFADVFNPNTGQVAAQVPLASAAEVADAVARAVAGHQEWAAQNPQSRARVLMRFVDLVHRDMDDLARELSIEHGKTLADARGDVQRGLEVVEFSIGIPHLIKGEFTEGAGAGIDVHSIRQPLGVVAGITPFNFPAMIPLWQAGPALACGNAFILKPSERDPSVPVHLARLFTEAGLPDGVFQVVHGDVEAVDALLAHPDVKALGFVGSSDIAQYIYSTAAANGKRSQCFGGAKNHMIVMPDADLDIAADALLGAGYGSAGERCMAISVAVPVGEATAEALRAKLIERVNGLRVGHSLDPKADYGPLVAPSALDRVRHYLDAGVAEGAELVIDGRDRAADDAEFEGDDLTGFFIGPSLFDRATRDMSIYTDEIFGPVLTIVRAGDYEEALALASDHQYGNGVAIFTNDGDTARDFTSRVEVGMVGVNVPIPVPVAYHTFGGWKRSGFGDLNQHGPAAITFYTRTKTVTTRWPSSTVRAGRVQGSTGAEFVIPTMK
ncbi:methylmalonate-semialdehyde dehydrogenase [Gordonia araii NBRC 100433]|uniref:methylmalonate-semialdehyde dehydrogenase (CoA acylating) n=1 Tax=Gordonia araii NBRC 100433 TaxID=1073574 RepID=G7GYD7_9ACTN|nr:CoA-acylating methylmalonate-semialdehyde dehydrogenase [Gordonia araii]NNG97390.1 CoA-acylating methylmalonate-semialdehyde dehydrogenase [Gordonia araii NBRC 100433]GAB08612.1 methylmalonate-semialdehyde dehydrogenase [Gordonia araii NBRC 100433]